VTPVKASSGGPSTTACPDDRQAQLNHRNRLVDVVGADFRPGHVPTHSAATGRIWGTVRSGLGRWAVFCWGGAWGSSMSAHKCLTQDFGCEASGRTDDPPLRQAGPSRRRPGTRGARSSRWKYGGIVPGRHQAARRARHPWPDAADGAARDVIGDRLVSRGLGGGAGRRRSGRRPPAGSDVFIASRNFNGRRAGRRTPTPGKLVCGTRKAATCRPRKPLGRLTGRVLEVLRVMVAGRRPMTRSLEFRPRDYIKGVRCGLGCVVAVAHPTGPSRRGRPATQLIRDLRMFRKVSVDSLPFTPS